MNISLPTQLETWMTEQIQTGIYANTNEVLTDALELLKMRVALEQETALLSADHTRRAALRELVEQGQDMKLGY